jgi:hypothetical protein
MGAWLVGSPALGPSGMRVSLMDSEPAAPPLKIPSSPAAPAAVLCFRAAQEAPRYFLALCDGKDARLSTAVDLCGIAVLLPVDSHAEWGGELHNILRNDFFEQLLMVCASGAVGAAHGAPPCGPYSILRERGGGPPPLRWPGFLNGLDQSSPVQLEEINQSRAIHERVAACLQEVIKAGGAASWEQPPSSRAHGEPCNIELCKHLHIKCEVDQCMVVDEDALAKAWLFMCSHTIWEPLQSLSCVHGGRQTHTSFAGKKNRDGSFVSASTALYPWKLCQHYAQCLIPLLRGEGARPIWPSEPPLRTPAFFVSLEAAQGCTEEWMHSHSETKQQEPMAHINIPDGGGVDSSADWATPKCTVDTFRSLRHLWSDRVKDWQLLPRLRARLARNKLPEAKATTHDHLLTVQEITLVRQDLLEWLRTQGIAACVTIPEGQPFALNLWQGCMQSINDVDCKLMNILEEGVPLGIEEPIQPSGVWRPKAAGEEIAEEDLFVHESPWPSGLKDPHLLWELVQEDIQQGFLVALPGGKAEAECRWPGKIAAGKLGIVQVDGHAARLVGDSSISGTNGRSVILEKTEHPTLHGVSEFVSANTQEEYCAFSLDFNAAHKRIKIRPTDQGYNIFVVPDPTSGELLWYYYKVCHFGGRWSGYWWSRAGASLIRLIHRFIFIHHYLAIYVDDILGLVPAKASSLLALLVILLMAALNAPLSWHKLALSPQIAWIGWDLDFSMCVAKIPRDKQLKLVTLLGPIIKGRSSRSDLQTLIGLLIWVSAGAMHIRPWLAAFYKLLFKPNCSTRHLAPPDLAKLHSMLDEHLTVTSTIRNLDVQQGWKLHGLSHTAITCRSQVCSAKLKNGKAWAIFHHWDSNSVRADCEAKFAAQLMLGIVNKDLTCRLRVNRLDCPAAADAFAEGESWGIGGWWLPSNSCSLKPLNINWFSQTGTRQDLPAWFTKDAGDLQSIIAALEALAQLVLMTCRCKGKENHPNFTLVLKQLCDNQGVVGASAKALSNKPPLSHVLQATSHHAVHSHVALQVQHVAGIRNAWADSLSRGSSQDPDFWKELDSQGQQPFCISELLSAPWMCEQPGPAGPC